MPIPARPGLLLVAALAVTVAVIGYALLRPKAPDLAPRAQVEPAPSPGIPPAQRPVVAPTPAALPAKIFIDPANQARAEQLNAADHTVQDDLRIVSEFISLYRKAHGGNPVGQNEDIVAVLTGTANPTQPGRVFPPNSPAIRDGKLVDRWGTPYWFHAESGTKMEIRSAGPDKSLFTSDDVILSP